jgi:hypothetical protein
MPRIGTDEKDRRGQSETRLIQTGLVEHIHGRTNAQFCKLLVIGENGSSLQPPPFP